MEQSQIEIIDTICQNLHLIASLIQSYVSEFIVDIFDSTKLEVFESFGKKAQNEINFNEKAVEHYRDENKIRLCGKEEMKTYIIKCF